MAVKKYALMDVIKLLKEAASKRSVVTYAELWSVFDTVDSEGDQWDTLAEAVNRICPPYEAIYGALMSAQKTGLPGMGFYRIFHDDRSYEYADLVGDVEIEKLSAAQMKKLTDYERANVYKHAAKVS